MSTSANNVVQQGDCAIKRAGFLAEWVISFLEMAFFDKCSIHDDMQKNEVNRYCITCNASACKHCIRSGAHGGDHHALLTIYRHVYQNVVPLSQMENHIDCRRIQPYKCNKKWVVSLTPLPHNGSGLLIEGDGACYLCKRKLTDPDRYHYCSVACKVQSNSVTRVINFPKPIINTNSEMEKSATKRRRKGVPHRAPFF